MWTFFAGIFATALLDAAVSSSGSAARAGGIFGVLGAGMNRLIDPSVPAIGAKATSATTPASTPASVANPAPTKPGTGGTNPLQAPPAGATQPPRDYNPPTTGGA